MYQKSLRLVGRSVYRAFVGLPLCNSIFEKLIQVAIRNFWMPLATMRPKSWWSVSFSLSFQNSWGRRSLWRIFIKFASPVLFKVTQVSQSCIGVYDSGYWRTTRKQGKEGSHSTDINVVGHDPMAYGFGGGRPTDNQEPCTSRSDS